MVLCDPLGKITFCSILCVYMHQERMTLYHATDEKALDAIQESELLFGYERLYRYEGYSGESNLTTDRVLSLLFITLYRGGRNYRVVEGPSKLFLLEFSIPGDEVKFVGQTHGLGCDEYAGTGTVDVDVLPDVYLHRLHAGMHWMSRDKARGYQQQGLLRFYAVPMNYMVNIETV